MQPYGVIIGGGNAVRMGGHEKPLSPFRGAALIDSVIERAAPQVARLALNVRETSLGLYARYKTAGMSLVADDFDTAAGPLGGVAAALDWAARLGGNDWLATFPSDTPFLPADMVSRLMRHRDGDAPVVAVAGGRVQGLCALWPVSCRGALRDGIADGRFRSVWWTLKELGVRECPFEDAGAFFNVNTPDDLAEAERLAEKTGGPQ